MVIKCYICDKNIDLINFRCKCNNYFCLKHKMPEKHDCKFDFKKDYKKVIEKNNPIVINKKINV